MTDHGSIYIFVALVIYLVAAVLQLFYYFFYYAAPCFYKPAGDNESPQAVSVIICARNEAENLKRFLPAILEQDYPDYEVIVVNDCSEDDSYLILGNLLLQYPHLRISTVFKDPKFTHNKKFAQFIGIKAAKNEILLFTDADCKPESDKWIRSMTSHFHKKTDFVLGYGGYMKERGLLNTYLRYDCVSIAMQYFGMAIRGIPYMGVGRNLAYRRTTFFANNGFGNHNHLISGDDDLFVNSNANRANTSVEFGKGTHTRSVPASSFNNWVLQKKRHLTTAPYYRLRDKIVLMIEPISRVLFYSAFIVLLSFRFDWILVSSVFAVRAVTQFTVYYLIQKRFNEQGLIPYLLIFDIFSPFLNGILYLSNTANRSGKNEWR